MLQKIGLDKQLTKEEI